MQDKVSALVGASILLCALAQTNQAAAEQSEIADPVSCSTGNRIGPIWDFGLQGARNSVGDFEQDIVAAVGAYSVCINGSVRLKFEGSIAEVEDDLGSSQSYVGGVGLIFQVAQGIVISPTVYLGYENLYNGNDQEVAAFALPATYTHVIEGPAEQRDSYFIVEARPEYVDRQAANPENFGTSLDGQTFVAYGGMAYDRPLSEGLRGRVRLGHRYIDTDAPTDSITYATVSVGGENEYGGYAWIADVTYSAGSGDYDGLLFGLTFRGVV